MENCFYEIKASTQNFKVLFFSKEEIFQIFFFNDRIDFHLLELTINKIQCWSKVWPHFFVSCRVLQVHNIRLICIVEIAYYIHISVSFEKSLNMKYNKNKPTSRLGKKSHKKLQNGIFDVLL